MTKRSVEGAFEFLKTEIDGRERRPPLTFQEFFERVRGNPKKNLRNVFQLFHDMIQSYVGEGVDEYPNDPESIGFIKYDCSRLFVDGADNPFFADRLFANRFIRHVKSLKRGLQQNRIYVFEGPPGCGKSTFLNNLLGKFEDYTNSEEGQGFEIFWDITLSEEAKVQKVEVPCPSHDYPILVIPKKYRGKFLEELLGSKVFSEICGAKEYEWLLKDEACTICKSIFWALFDKLGSVEKVLGMARARPYGFDRRLGEGISVFNPGDKSITEEIRSDRLTQQRLNKMFGVGVVKYLFSSQARTNNGIFALMDIKDQNEERILALHNVISEGVHRVDEVEERISSLFIALMNPEDKTKINERKSESFQARIQYIKLPYVLEVPTEVRIYASTFGDAIRGKFLPRVLDNFARVIISSRMKTECVPLKNWIPDMSKYARYCDESGLLLRMEIYSGIIPPWLAEEDRKGFTADIRQKMIAEAEDEGDSSVESISGRDSISLFGELLARYASRPKLINMKDVVDFFKHQIGREARNKHIPPKLIDSLVRWYNYDVLGEVKESLYFYNEEQIREDVLHYLWAINFDLGVKTTCKFTGKEIEVTMEFLKLIGGYITGDQMSDNEAEECARYIQGLYVEVLQSSSPKKIQGSDLYKSLFEAYVRNLKERALQPFVRNDVFYEAVKAFGTNDFRVVDTRLKEHIVYMIRNLVDKFGYTEQGAKEICLYVLEERLAQQFS